MISYVNVHAVLEGRRNRAKAAASDADASQVSFFFKAISVICGATITCL